MTILNRTGSTSLSVLTISALALSALFMPFAQLAHAADFVTTSPATNITTSDATLNGINQSQQASNSSFWVATSTFSTSPTSPLPEGVYSTPLLGPVAADASFSSPLSAVAEILPVTANTTYYYAAWTEVQGVWSHGSVESFTTAANPSVLAAPMPLTPSNGYSTTTAGQTSATWSEVNSAAGGVTYVFQVAHDSATNPDGSFTNQIYNSAPLTEEMISTVGTPDGVYYWHVQATDANDVTSPWSSTSMFTVDNTGVGGTIGGTTTGGTPSEGTLAVTSVTTVNSAATANGTFESGWKYLFHITVPTNETNLAMKFADWFNSAASSTIAAANNIRISSAQADNANATVLITAANTYSSPALHMTGDLNAGMAGMQVDVLVEAAVPSDSVNGSYTTSYGVRTLP